MNVSPVGDKRDEFAGKEPITEVERGDFGPGLDHVVDVEQNGKVIAFLHKDDPVRHYLASLDFDPGDIYIYVFVHGGQEFSRFENLKYGTHEIPDYVVAQLLVRVIGGNLESLAIRMCTCYGNMLRPGDQRTAVGRLASLLPKTFFEGYHGMVQIDLAVTPPQVVLGVQLVWDPVTGPYQVGPPGPWEAVVP